MRSGKLFFKLYKKCIDFFRMAECYSICVKRMQEPHATVSDKTAREVYITNNVNSLMFTNVSNYLVIVKKMTRK